MSSNELPDFLLTIKKLQKLSFVSHFKSHELLNFPCGSVSQAKQSQPQAHCGSGAWEAVANSKLSYQILGAKDVLSN